MDNYVYCEICGYLGHNAFECQFYSPSFDIDQHFASIAGTLGWSEFPTFSHGYNQNQGYTLQQPNFQNAFDLPSQKTNLELVMDEFIETSEKIQYDLASLQKSNLEIPLARFEEQGRTPQESSLEIAWKTYEETVKRIHDFGSLLNQTSNEVTVSNHCALLESQNVHNDIQLFEDDSDENYGCYDIPCTIDDLSSRNELCDSNVHDNTSPMPMCVFANILDEVKVPRAIKLEEPLVMKHEAKNKKVELDENGSYFLPLAPMVKMLIFLKDWMRRLEIQMLRHQITQPLPTDGIFSFLVFKPP